MRKIILIIILLLLLAGDIYTFIIPAIKENKIKFKDIISSILIIIAVYLASIN